MYRDFFLLMHKLLQLKMHVYLFTCNSSMSAEVLWFMSIYYLYMMTKIRYQNYTYQSIILGNMLML